MGKILIMGKKFKKFELRRIFRDRNAMCEILLMPLREISLPERFPDKPADSNDLSEVIKKIYEIQFFKLNFHVSMSAPDDLLRAILSLEKSLTSLNKIFQRLKKISKDNFQRTSIPYSDEEWKTVYEIRLKNSAKKTLISQINFLILHDVIRIENGHSNHGSEWDIFHGHRFSLNPYLPMVISNGADADKDIDTKNETFQRILIPHSLTPDDIFDLSKSKIALEDWFHFDDRYKRMVRQLRALSNRIEDILKPRSGKRSLYVILAMQKDHIDSISAADYIRLRNKLLKFLHKGNGLVPDSDYAWMTRNDYNRGYNTHLFLPDARLLNFVRAEWMKQTEGRGICCEVTLTDYFKTDAAARMGYAIRYLLPVFKQKDNSLKGFRCHGCNTSV